ncbi:MAG: ATP-binding protein [Patescibacteria group bacterium]
MIVFDRYLEKIIEPLLFKKRAILIFGPRQAGKTTLAKKLLEKYSKMNLDQDSYFNCDEVIVRNYFKIGQPYLLKELVGERNIVVFDEAQTIQNIGKILKVFIDTYPDVQIIATGSSSFDLANKINEPLTGRAFEFTLYPLSIEEIRAFKKVDTKELYEIMRLGSYPAIIGEQDSVSRESLLKNITTNYLYKDIYVFESIKNPQIFEDLIKNLAYQVGSEVSVSELANSLKTSRANIEKYIKLLEQSYIIKKVKSYAKNGRNELKKSFKIYFVDTGIRNAVLGDIASSLENRKDKGALFENFFFLELLKNNSKVVFPPQIFFWRTRDQKEVDFLEVDGENINAYECKWSDTVVSFKNFLKLYPNAKTKVVIPRDFI